MSLSFSYVIAAAILGYASSQFAMYATDVMVFQYIIIFTLVFGGMSLLMRLIRRG